MGLRVVNSGRCRANAGLRCATPLALAGERSGILVMVPRFCVRRGRVCPPSSGTTPSLLAQSHPSLSKEGSFWVPIAG